MKKKYIVNKCGGSIMVPALLPLVKNELKKQIQSGYTPIVVVSAIKDVTDFIIAFLGSFSNQTKTQETPINIEEFINQLREKHLRLFQPDISNQTDNTQITTCIDETLSTLSSDLHKYQNNHTSVELEARIISYGEKLSALCATEFFSSNNLDATTVFAEDIPLLTDNVIKDANILYSESEGNLQRFLCSIKNIPVIAGFTGKTLSGSTTLLGRGGTDTTACFVGAVVRAHKVVLWKDVGAIYSADPKLVPAARAIPYLSYNEIEEAGKIIQGKAIHYLRKYKIATEIASLVNAEDKTTVHEPKKLKFGAKMVSFKKNLTLFSLHQGEARGYERLSELSNLCARYKVNVVLVWNDPAYFHIAVENTSGMLQELTKEMNAKFPQIVIASVHMVTIVGNFTWKDVNIFNKSLNTIDKKALMGAYPYPNCMRMEGIVLSNNDIALLLRTMHKVFIHK